MSVVEAVMENLKPMFDWWCIPKSDRVVDSDGDEAMVQFMDSESGRLIRARVESEDILGGGYQNVVFDESSTRQDYRGIDPYTWNPPECDFCQRSKPKYRDALISVRSPLFGFRKIRMGCCSECASRLDHAARRVVKEEGDEFLVVNKI